MVTAEETVVGLGRRKYHGIDWCISGIFYG